MIIKTTENIFCPTFLFIMYLSIIQVRIILFLYSVVDDVRLDAKRTIYHHLLFIM